MMDSNQVSSLFAQQNATFYQQNQIAQQIGISPAYANIGGYGFGVPSPPQSTMGGPGFGPGPRPYNYAPGGLMGAGYAPGNAFAGNVMSGIGMAGTLGLGALGMASMFKAGSAIAPLVDPFSAFGLARGMGFGIGGALGAAAMPLAGMGIAAHGIHSFAHGGQQQQMINSTLGANFNHFNPSSRTGMGFSRQDSQAIGAQIRTLAEIPELLTSVSELTALLPKLKQSGVMQGVKDVTEFRKRFKESIDTIRDTAKLLGTTMDEASQFFAQSRGMGFFGKQATLQNALNVQLASGLTGMSVGQTTGVGMYGADLATSMGARRGLGSTAALSMAQHIGQAQREGLLPQGLLEDVTGAQGSEATQAGSQMLTQKLAQMAMGTPAGRLLTSGMVKFDSSGRAIGVDEDIVRRLKSGAIGVSELKSRAMNLTEAQKVSFKAREADIALSMVGQLGGGGVSKFMQGILGDRYGTDTGTLLMQKYGFTAGESDLLQGIQTAETEAEYGQISRIRAREGAIKERTDPRAFMRRLKTKLHAETFGRLEKSGAEVFGDIGKWFDEKMDDFVGRAVITAKKEHVDAVVKAFSGASGGKELDDLFNASMGLNEAQIQALGNKGSLRNQDVAGGVTRTMMAVGTLGISELLGGMVSDGTENVAGGTWRSAVASGIRGDWLGRALSGYNNGKFEDSEFAASLKRGTGNAFGGTGRTLNSERAILGGDIGLSGLSLEEAASSLDKGYKTTDVDVKQAFANVANFRRQISGELEGKDSAERRRYLKERIEGALSKDLGLGDGVTVDDIVNSSSDQWLQAAIREGGRKGKAAQTVLGMRKLRAGGETRNLGDVLIAGSQSGKGIDDVRFSEIAGDTGGLRMYNDVTSRARMVRQAETELRDVIKGQTDGGTADTIISTLKDRPDIKRAISIALMGDDKEAAREAIMSGDTTYIKEKLGYTGDLEELQRTFKVMDSVEARSPGSMTRALEVFEKARRSESRSVIASSFERTSKEMAAAADTVKGSLGDDARGLAGEIGKMAGEMRDNVKFDAKTRFAQVGAKTGELVSKLRKALKSGSAEEKATAQQLISQNAFLGVAVTKADAAAARLSRLTGEVNVEKAAAESGLSVAEVLSKTDGKTSFKMTDELREKLAVASGSGASVRHATGQGADAQEHNAAVLKTLEEISRQAKAQHDVLVSISTAPIFSGRDKTPAETADAAAKAAEKASAKQGN